VAAALEFLAKRKNFLVIKQRTTRRVALTEQGRGLLAAGVQGRQKVTQLTPELLADGGWRDVDLQPYDVTLAAKQRYPGKEHAFQRTLDRVRRVFLEMGFEEIVSPWVESSFWDFDALFQPQDHPARDMQDTFYTTMPNVLLRTQTSAGQIRAMREYYPQPIRVIVPGMCYRYEQISASKDIQFLQVEGLAVGKHIRLGDLLGTMTEFNRRIFGSDRKMRFRASYFPFTEPSVEVDISCANCGGTGCGVCKYTGWLEIAGSGMVHPTVLRNGGYDPAVYSGFAFGMGPQRIAMLKWGISDIRYFWANDLRFLEQF
jgi:phenylalanyl-tRNA synthetase alpha chain